LGREPIGAAVDPTTAPPPASGHAHFVKDVVFLQGADGEGLIICVVFNE
jgi:hypothetical protein